MAGPQITPEQVVQARQRLETLNKLYVAIKDKVDGLQPGKDPVSTLANSPTGADAERVKAYQELSGKCDQIFTPLRFAAGTKQSLVNKEIDPVTKQEAYPKELTDKHLKNQNLSPAEQEREKFLHKEYIEFANIQDWQIIAPETMAQEAPLSMWKKFKEAPAKAAVGAVKLVTGYKLIEVIARSLTDNPEERKYKENLNMDLDAAHLLDQEAQRCIAVLKNAGAAADKDDPKLISDAENIEFEEKIKSAQNILEDVDEHYFRRLKQLTEIGYGKASIYDEKADHKFDFLKYFDSRGFFVTHKRDKEGKPVIRIGSVPFYSASGRFHSAGALIGAYLDELVRGSDYKAEIDPDTGQVLQDAPSVFEHEIQKLNEEGGIKITQIPSGYPYEALAFLANATVIAKEMGTSIDYDVESLMQNMSTRAWLIFNKEFHTNFNKYIATAQRELDRHVIHKDTVSTSKIEDVPRTVLGKAGIGPLSFGTKKDQKVTTSELKINQGVSRQRIVLERYSALHDTKTVPKPKETAAIQASVQGKDPSSAVSASVAGKDAKKSGTTEAVVPGNDKPRGRGGPSRT